MKKLHDLKVMCESLGLEPIPTRHRLNPDRYELSVNDCVKAIQDYYIGIRKSEGTYTRGLDFMLVHKTPMLATLLTSQSESLQNEVWSEYSDDWLFERKYNGVRLLIFYDSERNSYEVYSRNLDDTTMLPVDFSKYFKFNKVFDYDFILDTELVFIQDNYSEGISTYFEDVVVNDDMFSFEDVKFILLDCLLTKDGSVVSHPYRSRRTYLADFLDVDLGYTFEPVEFISSIESKEDFYYKVIDSGGEGVIAKKLDSSYVYKRSTDWLKIKPTQSGSINMNDTLDAYVSGFLVGDNNLISSLLFSIHVDNQGDIENDKLFCKLPVSRDLSLKLTHYSDDGSIILNEGFYHHVAEFQCDGLNSNLEMIHPRLVVWRLDKSFDKCVYDLTYLSSMKRGD